MRFVEEACIKKERTGFAAQNSWRLLKKTWNGHRHWWKSKSTGVNHLIFFEFWSFLPMTSFKIINSWKNATKSHNEPTSCSFSNSTLSSRTFSRSSSKYRFLASCRAVLLSRWLCSFDKMSSFFCSSDSISFNSRKNNTKFRKVITKIMYTNFSLKNEQWMTKESLQASV